MAPGISMFQDINNLVIESGEFNLSVDNSTHHHYYDYGASALSPDFIRRLRPPHYIQDLLITNRQTRVHTTCLWSVENSLVKTWLDAQDGLHRLWLFGRPGTGKSVLAAFLIDRVLQEHNGQEEITLYYFCKNKNDSPVHVLKDFIRQFLHRKDRPTNPEVANFVMEIFSQRLEYEFSMVEIEPYFLEFLGRFKRAWFIVDGLDECQEPGALVGALTKLPNSKILVLSRKERYIEVELADWERLEIGTASTTANDLEVFIADRVSNLVEKYRFLQPESHRIRDTILAKSAGMFQYAYVVCETLKQQTSHSAIARSLDTIPLDLMDLYNDYLSQRLKANSTLDNEVALRALQWILHSPQPLSLNLLGSALVVDLAQVHGTIDPEFLGDVKSRISDAVGILVEWHESDQSERTGIYFARLGHQSIREYFLNLKSETDEMSKDNKKWWGELNLPYHSLLSLSAHSVMLSTCVAVMKTAKIWEAAQQYHDSADKRRAICPISRERLDKQLCRNRSWSLWERHQLKRLEKDRKWRKTEAVSLHDVLGEVTQDLEGLEWVRNSRNQLEKIVRAEHPSSKEHELRTLTSILWMRERELMVYALRHVGKHLSETGALGGKLLTDSFAELAPQWRHYAYNILCQIEPNLVLTGPADLYTRDLIIALESFSTILEVIERLCSPRSTNLFTSFWLVLVSRSALASDSPSSLVWNAEVTKSLEASQASHRLRFMFSTVTNLVISLNNIELAVFNYDSGVKPLVGTGILLHSVWYCKQTLAQWMVSQNLSHLDPQGELLRSDEYLFPKLLLALPAVRNPPLHYPDQSIFNHPAFVPTLLILSVISFGNKWFLLQVALLCAHVALSLMRRYSFVPPRPLSLHLRLAHRCLLFLFALQMIPFPHTVNFVVMMTLSSIVGVYGYNKGATLERGFVYAMQFPHSRLQFIVYWFARNPNFTLSLYSTRVACADALLVQLNATIIYLLFEHAIHATIDPYRFHHVHRLYAGLKGSSSNALSVKM